MSVQLVVDVFVILPVSNFMLVLGTPIVVQKVHDMRRCGGWRRGPEPDDRVREEGGRGTGSVVLVSWVDAGVTGPGVDVGPVVELTPGSPSTSEYE